MTSKDAHRRVLVMAETVQKGKFMIETQRRSAYKVEDCIRIQSQSDLDNLRNSDKNNASQKRHFYVIKKHNSRTGEEILYCKVRGFLYVVVGNYVYQVAFLNSFKIDVKKN